MTTTEVAREAQQDWQRRALAHLWIHSDDAQWDELSAPGGLTVFSEAHGSTLTDVQGRSYLDGLAGLFLVNVGHGRTEIGAAMAEQARTPGLHPIVHLDQPGNRRPGRDRSPRSRPATSTACSSARAGRRRSRRP